MNVVSVNLLICGHCVLWYDHPVCRIVVDFVF